MERMRRLFVVLLGLLLALVLAVGFLVWVVVAEVRI